MCGCAWVPEKWQNIVKYCCLLLTVAIHYKAPTKGILGRSKPVCYNMSNTAVRARIKPLDETRATVVLPQHRNWLSSVAGDLEVCSAVMQSIVGITALVVVCLGVSTTAQKSCSLQLSNSVLRFGGKFFFSQYVLQTGCHCVLNKLKSTFEATRRLFSVSSHCNEVIMCMITLPSRYG